MNFSFFLSTVHSKCNVNTVAVVYEAASKDLSMLQWGISRSFALKMFLTVLGKTPVWRRRSSSQSELLEYLENGLT